ncbi:hypothetical protein E4S40_04985 [Algoriphagus kandeliae]|uniref:Addiction module protein n=1 Tax=Algoriphagus kandeliae TaxID=2562278 RepID=A0A4Y9QWV8_9BACT|nr:hypothetical protein [Algoriphagus kandeliae]TFV95576.1 hypothetical protein E4S40_04985 [Algoriphagus kandeliae]
MNTTEKKLDLIAWLALIEDQEVLNKIDQIRIETQALEKEKYLKPISEEELINSLKEAESDYQKGKIISQEELVKKIKQGKIL